MAKSKNKITTVRQHPRRVKPSNKNPKGITIVDQHQRRLPGTYLDEKEIYKIVNGYSFKKLKFPKPDSLDYKNGNKFDESIAVWADYFNKLFKIDPPLDPDMVKALIASESSFDPNADNGIGYGLVQITKQSLKILQDTNGEVKDFIFKDIRLKDLKNPDVSIPMGIRWLARKQDTATKKLGRKPTHDELAMEYKGLLKSKTSYQSQSFKNYKGHYERLKK